MRDSLRPPCASAKSDESWETEPRKTSDLAPAAGTPGSETSRPDTDRTRTYASRPPMRDEAAAAERAYGFAAETVYEVSERTVACCLVRAGKPTGLPKTLDALLRRELAALEVAG